MRLALIRLRGMRMTPGGSWGAVLALSAWPSTRLAAATTSGGRASTSSGRVIVFRESVTPRSSMPVVRRKRPTSESSLVVMLEKLIEPVRWARNRNRAVTVSPGASVRNSTRSSLSSCAPEMLSRFRLTLGRLAMVVDVFRSVTKASYGSPARTARGCENAMLKLGLPTSTLPAALPSTSTVPAARPSSLAVSLSSSTCSPSCSPSTRNSP